MRLTKTVSAGDWRTLEWFFGGQGTAFFDAPPGARIKVRYGVGWFGRDGQVQTLDGRTTRRLIVTRWSLTRARMQIRVAQTSQVTYLVFPGNILDSPPPPPPF